MPIDELHVRLGWALADRRLNEWEAGFARGFVAACKRGRNVSDRQVRCATRIVEGLSDEPLIEELSE